MTELSDVGNWSQYQKLVLAELERHNTLLLGIDERISNLKLDIERLKTVRSRQEDFVKQLDALSARISAVETSENIDDAIKKYRNWIVGILFFVITALLIPVLNLILHG